MTDRTTSPPPAGPSSAPPWRNRDFRLVWAGGLVNDLGDWLLIVALPLYVFTRTSSGGMTALLFLVEMLPAVLIGRRAGRIVDRWDLRRTLIATNVLQAVMLLPLLAVTPDRIWPAFVVAAAQSVLTRFNNPAKIALLPRLVSTDRLVVANSANAISDNIARLAGAPLGGVLVEVVGLGGIVVADGVSFLLVAVATWAVRRDAGRPLAPRPVDPAGDPDEPPGAGRAAKLDIRRTRPLPALLTTVLLGTFAQGLFLVLYLAFIVRKVVGDGTDVGVIRGMQALGGISGGLLVGRFARAVAPGRLTGVGYIGLAVVGAVTWNLPALTTAVGFYVVGFALAGVPIAALGVGTVTAAQRFTPPEHLGQLIGASDAVAAAGTALGTVPAGLLVDRIDVTTLLDGWAVLYVTAGVIALLFVHRDPREAGAATADRRMTSVA